MNGTTWKTITAGLAVLLIGALWTGNGRLASMETSDQYIAKQVDRIVKQMDNITVEVRDNSKRISVIESDRRGAVQR